ncbi:MAG: DUF3795 domain-containing protein [Dehalococcoidales bacterium]|nr:DUF3795 domain-containing protein [Dehalococcoidales bacterium]
MANKRIYSKCGFYCDHCPAFKDNSSTKAGRQRGSTVWSKYFGLHFNPETVRCEGCQSPEPWKTGNLLPDRSCPIRACAVYNDVSTCAHCSLFPCKDYVKRVPGADLRRQRESSSHIKITDDEYQEYIEPFEGQPHLKELHTTLHAEDITPPKPFPVAKRIVPFPIIINLNPHLQEEMRQLHSLLGNIFSAKADNYAGQVLLERKKPYLYVIIWILGLYGELIGNKLVLENTRYPDKKEISRLVRKRDNTLYEPVQEVVNSLKKYGIKIEFKPFKKNWILTLGVDESIVDSSILNSLKTYISSLVKKYGEPVYAGNYNLKGKAFKLFTRLEMNDL